MSLFSVSGIICIAEIGSIALLSVVDGGSLQPTLKPSNPVIPIPFVLLEMGLKTSP